MDGKVFMLVKLRKFENVGIKIINKVAPSYLYPFNISDKLNSELSKNFSKSDTLVLEQKKTNRQKRFQVAYFHLLALLIFFFVIGIPFWPLRFFVCIWLCPMEV